MRPDYYIMEVASRPTVGRIGHVLSDQQE